MGLRIDDIFNISLNNSLFPNWQNQTKEYLLLKNLRRKFKEIQRELKSKEEEIENLSSQMKFSKINEMSIENFTLNEEIQKMKNLYEKLLIEASANAMNNKDIEMLHASLTNQYKIIESTQQHLEEMREENNQKTMKIKNIKEKFKNFKREVEMERLKNKNDKDLVSVVTNEKESEIKDLKMKLEFIESELQIKQKFIEEIEERIGKEKEEKINELNEMKINLNQTNSKLIEHSKLLEDREKEIFNFKNLLEVEKANYNNLLKNLHKNKNNLNIECQSSYSVLNFPKSESQYELTEMNSEFDIRKEFDLVSQLILAILQVNKIDYESFKAKIFFELDEKEENNLTDTITSRLLEFLKLKSQEDRKIIKNYINYINSHFIKESFTVEKLREKFNLLFCSLRILSEEEFGDNNKILKNILTPFKSKLQKIFFKKDENLQGHLSAHKIKEILESLEIILEMKLNQQVTFLMKQNTNTSLYEMNYLNLLNLFSDEENKEKTKEESESKYLEISLNRSLTITNDFDKRIEEIFIKIANHLLTANLSMSELFIDTFKVLHKDHSYSAIYLKGFLKVLNEEVKLDLDKTDSFYLLNKLKHPGNQFNAEVIDLEKLKIELRYYGITDEQELNIINNNPNNYNNTINNPHDKNLVSKDNVIIEENISDCLNINNSDRVRNSFHIENYSYTSVSHRSSASLLILSDNKKCREFISNSDEDYLDSNKKHTKIMIDDVFSKVLEEIHSRNYEMKIQSQEILNNEVWDNFNCDVLN